MTVRISTAARNAELNALAAQVDAGPAPGYIELRTGAQPANANTAASGTLLVTLTLKDPAFGAASGGVITLDVTGGITATAAAAGTAGWGRVYDSTGAAVFDGAVGTSGAEFIMADPAITSGQTVVLLSGTVTIPAG